MASLAEEIKTFKEAGFSETEVESFKQEEIKKLTEAGFQSNEILSEFGLKELNLNTY